MQPWALVTPASRGIGLELVKRLLRTTDVPVVATARKDLDQVRENALSGLNDVKEDRLHLLEVDMLGKPGQRPVSSAKPSLLSNTLYRRILHLLRGLRSRLLLPQEIFLPPPRLLHSRHPLPGKITLADRLRRRSAYLSHQHPRSHDNDQALLSLPSPKSHRALYTIGPPSPSSLGQYECACRQHQR